VKPRADDDYEYTLFLGIGTVSGAMEPEPDETPGVWLPMERSRSRMGGWKLTPLKPPRARSQIGFQPKHRR
jgi:hypothetical protein